MKYFDPEFYRQAYKDLSDLSPKQAASHYVHNGVSENRCPSRDVFYELYPNFDKEYNLISPNPQILGIYYTHGVVDKIENNESENDFDPATYLRLNPDIKNEGFNTLEKAYTHWKVYGQYENRPTKMPTMSTHPVVIDPSDIPLDDPIDTIPPPGNESIGVLVTLYYKEQLHEITNYLNRLPYRASIYISTPHNECFDSVKKHLCNQNIIQTPFVEYGMDIGNFINQIKYLRENNIEHDKYLKIHSKHHTIWRQKMFESMLPVPTSEFISIFKLLDQQHYVAPGLYSYPLCYSRQNESINKHRLKACKYPYPKVYPKVNKLSSEFSPSSYIKYNYDLKNLWRFEMNTGKIDGTYQQATHHYFERKNHEKLRIHTPIRELKPTFWFSAGTMFWFDSIYLKEFFKKTEPLDQLIQKLSHEHGALKNTKDTVTHSLEYWFGIVAGIINEPPIKSVKRINFLLPPTQPDSIISGGFRTLFRHIKYLQDNNYIVSLQICWCDENKLDIQREQISQFGLIHNINDIKIYGESETCVADVHVATGWQTFNKCRQYELIKQHTCFFCQDLEYEFVITKSLLEEDQQSIYDFYTETRPTYTMSNYLKHKLGTMNNSNIVSTRLTVDTSIYSNKNKTNRTGICMVYSKVKKHRLPEITLNIARKLADKYPDKPIYLFGENVDECEIQAYKNIHSLGELTVYELNDLYNKCELGTCFSTTNPSRVGFEMISSGCVCIEIDCEYTEHDLPREVFELCKPEEDQIFNQIDHLLSNKTAYHSKYDNIKTYKGQTKSEESLFYDMLLERFYL